MPEQKVAFGAFTAVHTLVVLEDIFHIVHLHGVVPLDLTAVTTDDFHTQAARDYLTLVAVLVALILGSPTGLVI